MRTDRAQNPVSNAFLSKALITTMLLMLIFNLNASAQCVAPTLSFNNPVLISGREGTVGAIYLFPNVIPGVDCHAQVMELAGGATISEIDNTTQGYYDAFQPYVWAGGRDTSFLDWKFTFKKAGTRLDTTLACLAVTAIDIDGNNLDLREFVEAATPGSFAVDPFTNLTISFDGLRSRAEGQIATIPLIDSNQRQAMFQMNFKNINSLLYKNGSISTGDGMTRHTCIYFKPFFENWIVLLPVNLLSFTAREQSNGVLLNWSATNEENIKNYTVQKSVDGKKWKNVRTLTSARSTNVSNYVVTDPEKNYALVYYRLKHSDTRGLGTYSKIIKIGSSNALGKAFSHNTLFSNSINLQINATSADLYLIEIHHSTGQKIIQKRTIIINGVNSNVLQLPSTLPAGMYLLSVKDNDGNLLYHSKIFKN